MFKWLKAKAEAAARKQCILNIRLNTKTLISVANHADKKMLDSGGHYSKSDALEIMKAGKALLTDIRLGIANGIKFEVIEHEIVRPILSEEQADTFSVSVVEDAILAMKRELENQ